MIRWKPRCSNYSCYGRSFTNLILTDTRYQSPWWKQSFIQTILAGAEGDKGPSMLGMERSWPLRHTRASSARPSLSNPSPRMFLNSNIWVLEGADLQPPEGLGPDELEDWELKNLPCKELLRRLEKNLTCREMLRRAVVTEAREKERRAPVKRTTHAQIRQPELDLEEDTADDAKNE